MLALVALALGAPAAHAGGSVTLAIQIAWSTDPLCFDDMFDQRNVTVIAGTTLYGCYQLSDIRDNSGGTGTISVQDDHATVPGTKSIVKGQSVIFVSNPFVATTTTTHTVTATGTSNVAGWSYLAGPDLGTVTVLHPALSIQKTVSTDGTCPGSELVTVYSGTTVTYCYSVTNTGDTGISNVVINDNGNTFPIGTLAPGASGSASTTVVALSDQSTTAVASGTSTVLGAPVSSPPDGASVDVIAPKLSISTTVSTDGTCPGSELVNVLAGTGVTWCYAVTNNGDTTVDNIGVSDDVFGTIPGGGFSLAPGATTTLALSAPANIDTTLTAQAAGTDDVLGGAVLSNQDPAAVNVVSPNIDIDVTVSTDGNCPGTDSATVPAGTNVTYCYKVTNNSSDDTLTNIDVFDQDNNLVGTISSLPPGGSTTLSGPPTLVQNDGSQTGTAIGTDPFGFGVSDSDTAFVTALFPGLSIAKTVSTDGTCPGSELVTVLTGTTVTYCYVVTNTGGTNLTGVSVDDNGIVVSVGDLVPGQSASVSAPYTATSDVDTAATASGINAPTGGSVSSAPDDAAVDVVSPKLSISTTVSTDGTCPGSELVNVLSGTGVTWCYVVTNTGDTTVSNIAVTDDVFGAVSGTATLAPGDSVTLSRPATATTDVTLSAYATGSVPVTGTQVVSNLDPAAVNVVSPGIDINVTVSTDGNCPGLDAVTVPAGTAVTYCYAVTNTGDDALENVIVTDASGVIQTIPVLGAGETVSFQGSPVTINNDASETATAAGTDSFGFPVTDTDTALVHAIFANLSVVKSGPASTSGGAQISYSIAVSSNGEATAMNATVTDALPAGLSFVSATATVGSCSFTSGVVTCALGNLAPGASATVTVTANVTATSGSITNTATVSTTTPETNYGDDSSSTTTTISTGATRTIGFYATHPQFTAACLAKNNGYINLGWIPLRDEKFDNEIDAVAAGNGPDKDNRKETGLAMAMGILNANVAHWTNKTKRTALEQARMQAGQQVLGAICNSTLIGTAPPFNMNAAVQTLAGTNISAILAVGAAADAYNNSGDAVSLNLNPGPADPKFAWDDPTDPND